MLPSKTIVFLKGSANWDSAFETLVEAFKKVKDALQQAGGQATGPPMTIYTSTDDTGFEYQAGVPVAEEPKGPLRRAWRSENRQTAARSNSSTAAPTTRWTSTYEAITNHLDEKRLEAKDLFVEYYLTDPFTTPEDNLVIEVYVPVK